MFLGWILQNFDILGLRAGSAAAMSLLAPLEHIAKSPGHSFLLCLDADSESFSTQYPSPFRTQETEIQRCVTPAVRVSMQEYICVLSLVWEGSKRLDSVSS